MGLLDLPAPLLSWTDLQLARAAPEAARATGPNAIDHPIKIRMPESEALERGDSA